MPPTQVSVDDATLELTHGDITAQDDMEAIVNAANAQLQSGGGVAGAIHDAAGSGLAKACHPKAPIEPGEAVITEGFKLPNDYVIHVLGPVYGRDEPSDVLLKQGYKRALDLAEQHKITSIAFPALSTGAFGYPMREAAEVALQTMLDRLPDLEHVKTIRFVLFDEEALTTHEEALDLLLARM
jgi:O-acetyl-ADP-ribose deacetylase (regulator of RNase III)